ncbi:MAG: xanthine dehydrogenase family protein subunit M [Granulosicoccus sp.]
MHEFVYREMNDIEQAVAEAQRDEDAVFLAGGMTLLPTLKQRLAQPSQLLDLGPIKALAGIEQHENNIVVGAGTSHADVARSELVRQFIPVLSTLALSIGDPQVRNRGTLGGSIANADPAADYPAAVVALNATICTHNREISAENFFVDLFETALEEGELVTAVRFPCPKRAAYASFRNPASRYAIVGVCVVDTGDSVRIGVTGAAESVFRWRECELALAQGTDVQAIGDLALPATNINDDIHASADYRAHLVRVMTAKAINAL